MKELFAKLTAITASGVWSAVKNAAGRLWRSFLAVWTNPATYPVIAVLAFGCYVGGHAMGARHVPRLRADLVALQDARERLAAENTKLSRQLQALRDAPVAASPAVKSASDGKVKAKKVTPIKAAPKKWF